MFLPICKKDLIERNIDELDFVYVIGDAYVDHPSFGFSIISRVLEAMGFLVGIIAQPNPKDNNSIAILGKPKLGFLVSAGNIDSMVNNYTSSKRKRNDDVYSEGGIGGKRPTNATIIYCKMIKEVFPDSPIIIGGIEASLRRLAHYDYLNDGLRPSILIESNADIISYGMGEKSIVEIAEALKAGLAINDLIYIKGTVWKTKDENLLPNDAIILPTYSELKKDRINYAKSFNIQYNNTDPINGKCLIEKYSDIYVVQNTATDIMEQEYLDWVYSLPYERKAHPVYKLKVPALDEVKYSIAVNRGCFGSCSFCALTMHQGRIIQSRSKSSVVDEAKIYLKDKDFKGYIHDVGGPTANFYKPSCDKILKDGACKARKCLYPNKCPNLKVDHSEYLDILRTLRNMKGIKKVFVRSGLRYDYLMYDTDDTFFNELVQFHVSGQLKVAPEHISDNVLKYMQKPGRTLYNKFVKKYYNINKMYNLKQFLVPYLMSSHPGSTLKDAIMLAEYIRDEKLFIEQVQDFYPTPSTLATCMYYTGVDPRTLEKVYVPRTQEEKAMQRALLQYKNPHNYDLVYKALTQEKRFDLIGDGPKCLIRNKFNTKKF